MFDAITILLFWAPVGLIVYHWAIFPGILVFLAGLRKRHKESKRLAELPRVTIAIAAYNEERTIRAKILNCLDNDYPIEKLEVLVGSDASSDGTDSIVKSFTDTRVKLLRSQQHGGKAAVLNLLMGSASGDLVLFTDADVMLAHDTLQIMVRHFTDESVGVVEARYIRINKAGSAAEGFYDRYESKVKELEGRLGATTSCYGAALMARKSLCQPIPEDTVLDDFMLGIRPFRSGFSVAYEPRAIVSGKVENETQEFRRRVRIGRGNLQALLRFADLLLPKYGTKAWVFFSHKFVRMLIPFLLLSIFIASAIKFSVPFFAAMFILQLAAYATIPLLLVVKGRWRKVLFPQYYLFHNIAVVVGYWQYLFGRRQKYWQRTARKSE